MMRTTDTTYNFTGLIPYTNYNVTVAGRNYVGVGEPASVIVNAPIIVNSVPHGKYMYLVQYTYMYMVYMYTCVDIVCFQYSIQHNSHVLCTNHVFVEY